MTTAAKMTIPPVWTFKAADVADAFDAHVREQLPWYGLATWGVAQIVRHYVGAGGLVYDVGASTGNIGRAIAPILAERKARLVAIEESPEMAARYAGGGTLVVADASTFDFEPFDVAVLFLVLMFLRVDQQAKLLRRLQSKAVRGGAVVVVDKLQQGGGYAGTVLTRIALAAKLNAGASADDVLAKELSLAGVQRPSDPETYEAAGFRPWFRFGDFGGFLWERQSGGTGADLLRPPASIRYE